MAKYLNGVFVQTQPHDCRPNVGAQKAKIAMDAIKGDAETSVLRTGEIVNNNLQNLDNGNNSIILYGHFETIWNKLKIKKHRLDIKLIFKDIFDNKTLVFI